MPKAMLATYLVIILPYTRRPDCAGSRPTRSECRLRVNSPAVDFIGCCHQYGLPPGSLGNDHVNTAGGSGCKVQPSSIDGRWVHMSVASHDVTSRVTGPPTLLPPPPTYPPARSCMPSSSICRFILDTTECNHVQISPRVATLIYIKPLTMYTPEV